MLVAVATALLNSIRFDSVSNGVLHIGLTALRHKQHLSIRIKQTQKRILSSEWFVVLVVDRLLCESICEVDGPIFGVLGEDGSR